jgi:pSer/pThr/pTyr-binding forkhead associated (FHA) protein
VLDAQHSALAMAVRFVVRTAEGQPLSEELAYGFEQARIVIGRGASADVRIPHLTVSEVHATVRLDSDGYAITDNDSTNGTRVNGTRLPGQRRKRLHDGDRIDIGAYTLSFHAGVALAQAVTSERTAELARRLFRGSRAGARLGDPRLVLLSGPDTGKSVAVPQPPARLLLGRAPDCQLVLAEPALLPEHAELVRDLDGVLIKSLDPERPLSINEQSVAQRRLRDGDELLLGATRLLYEEPAEQPIEQLAAEPDSPLGPAPAPVAAQPELPAAPSLPAPRRSDPAVRAASTGPSFDADVLIYLFAAVVFAVSAAGLIALMTAE